MVRRTFSLMILTGLMAVPAVGAEPGKLTTRPAAKPAAQKPSKEATEAYDAVLTRILGAMGRISLRARVKVNYNSETGANINELKANVKLPFKSDIVVPLTKEQNNRTDALIPELFVRSRGLMLNWEANTDPNKKNIASVIRFTNRSGVVVPLVVEIESEMQEVVALRIYSVEFHVAGATSDSNVVTVKGSCDLEQNVLDLASGNVVWEKSDCELTGRINKKDGKTSFDFTYDSF